MQSTILFMKDNFVKMAGYINLLNKSLFLFLLAWGSGCHIAPVQAGEKNRLALEGSVVLASLGQLQDSSAAFTEQLIKQSMEKFSRESEETI